MTITANCSSPSLIIRAARPGCLPILVLMEIPRHSTEATIDRTGTRMLGRREPAVKPALTCTQPREKWRPKISNDDEGRNRKYYVDDSILRSLLRSCMSWTQMATGYDCNEVYGLYPVEGEYNYIRHSMHSAPTEINGQTWSGRRNHSTALAERGYRFRTA